MSRPGFSTNLNGVDHSHHTKTQQQASASYPYVPSPPYATAFTMGGPSSQFGLPFTFDFDGRFLGNVRSEASSDGHQYMHAPTTDSSPSPSSLEDAGSAEYGYDLTNISLARANGGATLPNDNPPDLNSSASRSDEFRILGSDLRSDGMLEDTILDTNAMDLWFSAPAGFRLVV